MALEYSISSKGKPTVLYRNFEYVKDIRTATGWSVAGIQVTLDPHWQCQHCSCMKGGRGNEEQDNVFDCGTIVVASSCDVGATG